MIAAPRQFLVDLFRHGVVAVDPRRILDAHWPKRPSGRLIVVGAGKAAAAMAQAAENHYGTDISGLVVTRDGYALPTRAIEVIEAGHPVPDERSLGAAQRIMALAQDAGPKDTVLCLWSGGASALLVAPAPGITFAEKQAINVALLKSGATIREINCVRKHLSAIKGGRFAELCKPAQVVSLIISDVVGDDPSIIASGPTVVDPTTCAAALAILQKYAIPFSPEIQHHLLAGSWESPKVLERSVQNTIVSRPKDIFRAAQAKALKQGLSCLDLGDAFDGDVPRVVAAHAQRIRGVLVGREQIKRPCVVLSGGEVVVKVTGEGRGGPNTEFILALARELNGLENVYALACDSDGTDGVGGHAGAVMSPDTLLRAADLQLDPAEAQIANNTAAFFEALGDLVVTGPTFTNVNDFRAILILCGVCGCWGTSGGIGIALRWRDLS